MCPLIPHLVAFNTDEPTSGCASPNAQVLRDYRPLALIKLVQWHIVVSVVCCLAWSQLGSPAWSLIDPDFRLCLGVLCIPDTAVILTSRWIRSLLRNVGLFSCSQE